MRPVSSPNNDVGLCVDCRFFCHVGCAVLVVFHVDSLFATDNKIAGMFGLKSINERKFLIARVFSV
jgi:hypothetical protein